MYFSLGLNCESFLHCYVLSDLSSGKVRIIKLIGILMLCPSSKPVYMPHYQSLRGFSLFSMCNWNFINLLDVALPSLSTL